MKTVYFMDVNNVGVTIAEAKKRSLSVPPPAQNSYATLKTCSCEKKKNIFDGGLRGPKIIVTALTIGSGP